MTKPPKTMEEIKQEWINEAFELEKAKAYKCCESCGNNFSNANTYFHYGFKAGFDCRDKLDNEALKIAVEALEFYADGESWSTIDHSKSPTTYDRLEYDKDLGDGDFQITEDTDDSNVSGLRARKSLAEIRKLSGDI